jgi:hypothetical protein
MEKILPRIEKPVIHVFRGTDNKMTIHTNEKIKAGDEINIWNDKVIVLKVQRFEKSTIYQNANFYELEFQKIN